ncbi:MAG TPA: hypothetical protein VJ746_16100 [Nitrospira sp.]|nr:hypothetical protein [Nitrospira sp.]
MRRNLTYGLICLAILAASPSPEAQDQLPQISPRWSSWLSAQDIQTSVTPAPSSLYQSSVTPTSSAVPAVPADVRNLSADTDRPRTQGILNSTAWFNGKITTEAEVARNQGGTAGLQNTIPGNAQDDPTTSMMRLGLSSSAASVRYGMTYRQAGQAYYNGADQAVREVWGEWKNGWTSIRSAVGRQWNNVAGDPTRSRLDQTYGRIGLSWNKPVWPTFAVNYSENTMKSQLDPVGTTPQAVNSHTLEAVLGYQTTVWTASLSSSYSLGTDLLHNGTDSRVTAETLTTSFRPFNTLTIAPVLGYRVEQQDASGVRTDSPSASLTMNYRQSQQFLITALGNYSGTKSSDRLTDLDNVGGKGILTWGLPPPSRDWNALLSFEGGYNRQINRLLPSADQQDLSGVMRFVLAPL